MYDFWGKLVTVSYNCIIDSHKSTKHFKQFILTKCLHFSKASALLMSLKYILGFLLKSTICRLHVCQAKLWMLHGKKCSGFSSFCRWWLYSNYILYYSGWVSHPLCFLCWYLWSLQWYQHHHLLLHLLLVLHCNSWVICVC